MPSKNYETERIYRKNTCIVLTVRGDGHFSEGTRLGWIGYPLGCHLPITPACFFSGMVSAFWEEKCAYLVDGVAINGVSGGPAFSCDEKGNVVVAGIVTNYYKNREMVSPGMTMVRSIKPLVELYKKKAEGSANGGEI